MGEEYTRVRELGRGAFGSATLYRRTSDTQLVVLKEMDLRVLSAEQRRVALSEVQLLAGLNHPNIVAFLDSYVNGDTLFIEMEYADGGDLHQAIAAAKQTQVCDAP
jgi:serine/threonine protein kinase